MAVGFRSFLRVDPGQSLLDTVIAQMNNWSAGKQVDVDASVPGRYALDYDNLLTIFREDRGEDGIYRWRRHHRSAQPRDVWRTTFTAVERPDTAGWLWTEIETFDDRCSSEPTPFSCMSVPRVLRELLRELSCRDGRTEITSEPQWVAHTHLPDLMDYLADESRLGAVYLASQGSRDVDEFTDWATQVTWHLVGLGSVFLLDPAIAPEFNDMVGEHHAVPAGTIRTYLPNVNLDDPLDPRRHKILGIGRITESSPRRLAGMLGLIERVRAAHAAIPADAVELDRDLTARETELQPLQRGASLRAIATPDDGTVVLVPAAEPTVATSDIAQLRGEIEELKDAFDRDRIHQIAILAQLEALVREIQALRLLISPDAPIQQRRLSAS